MKHFHVLFSFFYLSFLGQNSHARPEKNAVAKSPITSIQQKTSVPPKNSMHITDSAVSMTVDDVSASSRFFIRHFGFKEKISAPGFSSLIRPDAMNLIFLKRGIEVLPKEFRNQRAAGVIVAFTVKNIAAQEARLRGEGIKITLPLKTEAWGERLFQVKDPNGVVIELVEWVAPTTKK